MQIGLHNKPICARDVAHEPAGRAFASGYGRVVRLVITSDTHMPKRARDLPPALWAAIEAADVTIHAGDWVDVAALDAFEARAKRLVGVYGNNDGPALRTRLPEVTAVTLGGLRFAVIHETGDAKGRNERCAQRFPGIDVLVFGHSHIPWDATASTGLRLLNPGSPTDRRSQPYATFMSADLTDGRLDVVLHRIDRSASRIDRPASRIDRPSSRIDRP